MLELSIVIAIIAVITGMAISTSISVVATARVTATQQKMSIIEQALMQFRTANDRLPCPGDLTLTPGGADYGLEAGTDPASLIGIGTGVCTGTGMLPAANNTGNGTTNTFSVGAEGSLPAITLGLPPDFMVDAWGNKFRYAVDVSMTSNSAFLTVPVGCINGAITISDASGNARSSGSIYALISHGANGHGAYTKNSSTMTNAASININEHTNCHCGSLAAAVAYGPNYVQQDFYINSAATADMFDDLVAYKERWQMQTPWDKTGSCHYIYITDYTNNRIQEFSMQGGFIQTIGSSGSANGQVSMPEGIAFDSAGNMYVADSNNHRVQKLSGNGTFIFGIGSGYQNVGGTIGSSNTGVGTFKFPRGIALDSYGNIYVTDTGNYRVQKFNSSGHYISSFGGGCANGSGSYSGGCSACSTTTNQSTCDSSIQCGTPCTSSVRCSCTQGDNAGQFYTLTQGIATYGNSVYVADYQGSTDARIQKFDLSGNYATRYGTYGSGAGQFQNPFGIAFDTAGNLFIADDQLYRIDKLGGASGTPSTFLAPGNGSAAGKFNLPICIANDSLGNIYVLDSSSTASVDRVEKFDNQGNYINLFGSVGSGAQQFNTYYFGCLAIK
jgi:type II secretory pathway pseudopilin PulG/sugar lactone lactonase YvrE